MTRKATSRAIKGASILALGVLFGLACAYFLPKVSAQNAPPASPAFDSVDVRAELVGQAAPSVALDASGKARFSRPLEVPPLYAFETPLQNEVGRQLVLVDAETKRICVYWIRQRGANSTIELVATRAYELDLKLDDFNCEGLTPSQIREQLESSQP